jgi:hypothetical protein
VITLIEIYNELQKVLGGVSSYTSLQKMVDAAVISDDLPEDISPSARACIYDLQTTLELISEHQATNMGLSSFYSAAQIVSLLAGFKDELQELM